ncbi:hypothetical protein M9434_002926 [Picochlorum sp. BPE23]|nr:hypothetical protein M9434_002926 [Picochlorum sp. BPE23]KAI8104967.1 hypothetical protein M9435_000141 [Picochlorum sp. BPE23]WPT15401.1 hypothetical protein PSENEW3_00003342 [Picochlorum sp. SENEW3]|eukprot:jgi/Picre1/29418/NNA_004806.t1
MSTSLKSGDEDSKEVIELSRKLQENSARLKQLEGQKRQLEVEIRRAAFTAAHLDELPEDVATYMAVGKAYLFKPKNQILAELEETVKMHDSELKSSKATRENLISTQESLIKQLQEL